MAFFFGMVHFFSVVIKDYFHYLLMLFVADGPLEWFCGNWLPWVSLCIALYNNSVNFSSYPGDLRGMP